MGHKRSHSAVSNRLYGVVEVRLVMDTRSGPQQTTLLAAALVWFTVYRQLFAWILAFNLAVAIVAATQAWPWAHTHRVQFAVANTLISVLARNEVGCVIAVRL